VIANTCAASTAPAGCNDPLGPDPYAVLTRAVRDGIDAVAAWRTARDTAALHVRLRALRVTVRDVHAAMEHGTSTRTARAFTQDVPELPELLVVHTVCSGRDAAWYPEGWCRTA